MKKVVYMKPITPTNTIDLSGNAKGTANHGPVHVVPIAGTTAVVGTANHGPVAVVP